MHKEIINFHKSCETNINSQSKDKEFQKLTKSWFEKASQYSYSYNFEVAGRPIIQYPQDIVGLQEIIYKTKPDIIVETGIAHGGSIALSASCLSILDVIDDINPRDSLRKVIGIDINIRSHNLEALNIHPLSFKWKLFEGSSIDKNIIDKVKKEIKPENKVLVLLDSNHTHEHVLKELNLYADLVSINSYCIVYDTCIEFMPPNSFPNRDWDIGNNGFTAVKEWLKNKTNFVIDKKIENKLLITVAPSGFLKRVN